MAKTTPCPICGQAATITLFERPDDAAGTEGHAIEFRCTDASHALTEPEKLTLWAADRTRDLAR